MTATPTTHREVGGLHGDDVHGDRTPVVLVHAAIADRRQWGREVEFLAGRGHRVVTYDTRGFGESQTPTAPWFDHEDLVAVLDACGIERAILVGASNGGRICLDTAISAPDRVAALVLVGAALPGMPVDTFLEAGNAAEEAAFDADDVEAATEANLASWVDGHGRPDDAPADPRVREQVRGWLSDLLPRRIRQEHWPELVEPLVRDRLGDILVPTLVIVGEHDAPRHVLIAGRICGGVADGRLALVRGAAHLPNLERPDEFERLLGDFLDELDRGGEVAPRDDAVREFWAQAALRLGREADSEPPPAWAFGSGAAMADELCALVLAGTKRATAGAMVEYDAHGEPVPKAGDLSIVLDGSGEPRCVIRTTDVRVGPLGSVDAAFAFDEGEMDRTLATWIAGHLRYFHRTLPRRFDMEVDLDLELVFERFEVVYPGD